MARTLVISNADFSVNKLDTVSFNSKPCTAISLSSGTASITSIGGTSSLVATVTPEDTTDAVIWSSSDNEVATVAGGIITAVGCGTATITATCGEQSASCVVTVTHVASLTYAIDTYLSKDDNKDYLTGGALANRAIAYILTGAKAISGSSGMSGKYPYVIPKGATKIVITTSDLCPYGFWLASEVGSASQSSVAKAFEKDDFGTVPQAAGNRTVTIPDRTQGTYEGADAVSLVFKCLTTITQEMLNAIAVTFTGD